MQLFNRRLFVLESGKFYTRGLLIKLARKQARILKTFTRSYIEDDFFSEKQINAVKQTIEMLKPDIEDFVIYNYPYQEMIFATAEMPKLSDEQLRNAVKFKISEDFHIPPNKLIIDITKADNYIKTDKGTSKVPIFATKQEFMDKMISFYRGVSGAPEPDMVIPDQLKYLEIFDEKTLKTDIPGQSKLTFLICQDMNYSVLFTFMANKLIDITEISISLEDVIEECQKRDINPQKVLSALLKGSEIGALEYTESIQQIFSEYYEKYTFEAEKAIRGTINHLNIDNPLTRIEVVIVASINGRLTLDLAYHIREEGILRGANVIQMPLKKDYPDDTEDLRTIMGLGYRGVRELGRYKFIQKEKAKA
ncbi:MAG: hypothetical protein U9N62_03045 [Thermotogota bacterium]|nr:hypothetical protein [Thermotogota bacterium]